MRRAPAPCGGPSLTGTVRTGQRGRVGVTFATRTEIDGVPVFWRDEGEDFAVASIMFRVGTADETLVMRGVTHLIEHVALDFGRRRYPFNGMVDATRTVFTAHGTPDQLAEFLSTVCGRLAALELDSIDRHARILRTEANSRVVGWGALAADARLGAGGSGMHRYAGFALHWIGPPEVGEWAAARFTTGNAVVWMTCPPPAELRLPLPPGARHFAPEPRPLKDRFPMVDHWENHLVALTALTHHSRPARAGFQILEHDLEDELRHGLGLSYTITHGNEYLGPNHQMLLIAADCLPEAAEKVRDLVLASLERLGREGPTGDEMRRLRHEVEDHVARMSTEPAWMDLIAQGELHGFPVDDPDGLVDAYRAMSAADIRGAMATVLESGILFLPVGIRPPRLWRVRDVANRRSIGGDEFRPVRGKDAAKSYSRLTIGKQGVALTSKDGTKRTILWKRCVGIGWTPGHRWVICDDGFAFLVRAEDWKHGTDAQAL